tara:strand:+ start:581 stop:811 length:231 start_codon:yes stop_codon:yes gene_type:complete
MLIKGGRMDLDDLVKMYDQQIASATSAIKNDNSLELPKRRLGKLLSANLIERLESTKKLASKLDKANKRISDRIDE